MNVIMIKTKKDIYQPWSLTVSQKRYLFLKRIIDVMLSGIMIFLLVPLFGILSLVIKLDSPGPILFKQKRVGKDKELFDIWKFRTMRIDTPQNIPTHLLSNPEQYITKSGKFMRKTSLDEIPQIFNIFSGKMSFIGPRPALWNQDDLIEERDKYGANTITPGLTGWAQIHGRDRLEIPIKAKFDGEYLQQIGLCMDIKCFLGTVGSILIRDGVVEGGTGKLNNEDINTKNITSTKQIKQEIKTGIFVTAFFVIQIIFFVRKIKKQ